MATHIARGALVSESNAGVGLYERFISRMPWWALPLTVVSVLGGFSIYAIWTAFFAGGVNQSGPYLSPFYSPLIWATGPISPALWVLWSPLAFRATCYYYRKAYYRSFFWDPPACAVGELRHKEYRGEAKFPLILNNFHRYFFYAVLVVTGFLWYDVFLALLDPKTGHLQLGLGIGIMLLNVVLLSAYTFGCPSVRHLVGGGLDCYSQVRFGMARFRAWSWVSLLNGRHALFAWVSMFSVVIADIYIHLLRAGAFADPHIVF